MSDNTFGVTTLDVINELHRSGVDRYLVLMRHSARQYGSAEEDRDMRLTEEGRHSSFEFGKSLPPDSFYRFFSSRVRRCAETSEQVERGCLSMGGRAQSNIVMDALGPFYVTDWPKVIDVAYEAVGANDYPGFFRSWFDGQIPGDWIDDAARTARTLLKALIGRLDETPEPAGSICVSHDWHLVLLKEFYLEQRVEEYRNIGYLEGVILHPWQGGYRIVDHKRESRSLEIP